MVNFVALSDGYQYAFESTVTGSSNIDIPDRIFAHLSPNCDFKLLRWVLVRYVVKVQARFVCKLESARMERLVCT